MPEAEAPTLAQMTELLERVLAGSPAAATELVWIDARRGRETSGKRQREAPERRDSTVLVRVREAGRTGLHRCGAGEPSELENALRDALAGARLAAPSAGHALAPSAAPALRPELFDAELAHLSPSRARERLQRLALRDEWVRLSWVKLRMAVVNSAGLRCAAEATGAALTVSCGREPGAGSAAAAARSWQGLAPEAVVERARRRHAGAGVRTPLDGEGGAGVQGSGAGGGSAVAGAPPGPVPLVLSAEATATLLALLNRCALSSTAFRGSPALLRQNLGNQVFHSAIALRDDGTDPRGLPFPWDLFGWPKRPVDLIAGGVVLTPAVDAGLGTALGRSPTPHQVAPDESIASHLFLLAGSRSDEELLAAARGGLWIGALDPLECFVPATLRFRAVARGVRRLEDGGLGAAVPDLVWEDGLTSVLGRVLGVGSETVSLPADEDLFGAVTAPPLALEPGATLRPLVA